MPDANRKHSGVVNARTHAHTHTHTPRLSGRQRTSSRPGVRASGGWTVAARGCASEGSTCPQHLSTALNYPRLQQVTSLFYLFTMVFPEMVDILRLLLSLNNIFIFLHTVHISKAFYFLMKALQGHRNQEDRYFPAH